MRKTADWEDGRNGVCFRTAAASGGGKAARDGARAGAGVLRGEGRTRPGRLPHRVSVLSGREGGTEVLGPAAPDSYGRPCGLRLLFLEARPDLCPQPPR